jgi:hypothetical protein
MPQTPGVYLGLFGVDTCMNIYMRQTNKSQLIIHQYLKILDTATLQDKTTYSPTVS